MSITKHDAKFIVGGLLSMITLVIFVMYLTCPWTWLKELERRNWRQPWRRSLPRVVYRANSQVGGGADFSLTFQSEVFLFSK